MILPEIANCVELVIVVHVELFAHLSLVISKLLIFIAVLDHDPFKLSGAKHFVFCQDALLQVVLNSGHCVLILKHILVVWLPLLGSVGVDK